MKDKLLQIYSQEGIFTLVFRSSRFLWRKTLRNVMPKRGYQDYNNVKVSEKRLFDDLLGIYQDNPIYEEEYVNLIRENVSKGDKVVIIGGWHGVSTIAAAKKTGPSGKVVTYEATKKGAERIRKVAAINNVADTIEVKNRIVGSDVKDKKSGYLAEACIEPSSIEACDILALDCDGCELDVLSNMSIEPGKVIVEHHGEGQGEEGLKFEYDEEKLKSILASKGYEVEDYEVRERERYGYKDKIGWFIAERGV